MQWGLFSLQIPAGLFCGGTRMVFYSRVSAGCLLRVHARAFFFGILCNLFLGRERHLFFRGVVSLPPQPPPSLPALGARRGVLHEAEFLCRSLQGASAVARAWCFTRGSPRGVYCVCTRGLFFFGILCTLFFGEGESPAAVWV